MLKRSPNPQPRDTRPAHCRAAILFTLPLLLAGCGLTYEKGEPADLIERGWKEFRLENFDESQRLYLSAVHEVDTREKSGQINQARARQWRAQAYYGLGMMWNLRRPGPDSPKARQYLEKAAAADPGSEIAGWARLGIVRDDHIPERSDIEINVPKLRQEYGEVAREFAGTPPGTEAFMYRQTLFVQTLDEDDARTAIQEIDAFLAATDKKSYRSPLYALRAQAYVTLNDYKNALESNIKAMETKEFNPVNPFMNNLLDYYRIGLMAMYDVGDLETAKKYFHKILDEFPAEQKMFTVQRALALIDAIEKSGGDIDAAGTIGIRPPGPGVGGLPHDPAAATPGVAPEVGGY